MIRIKKIGICSEPRPSIVKYFNPKEPDADDVQREVWEKLKKYCKSVGFDHLLLKVTKAEFVLCSPDKMLVKLCTTWEIEEPKQEGKVE